MIERVFFNWDRPFLWQVEEYLFKNVLQNSALENHNIHLITPSQRSSRRLTELICAKAETIDLPIFNYEVNLISELPGYLNKQNPISRTTSIIYWHEALAKAQV